MRPIPDELAQTLGEWHTTYRQLSAHPRTVLRRKLIRLSTAVLFHPHWESSQRTAARSALHTTGWGGRS
ncbi:hypothetical protein QQY66_34080 [Streptomyces sp. DG2A-72]|uniref:hypothetical protein n=1 Tax=Streptomyces sp. DG2A-72 TaxID=3051386 RepID=UPI00265BDC79|nr:hypothetical protein [Streptomyces sp. DG2A-72]MDO0936489.1 hypothetical protein [Streptomyces sp. DG2A-72]